MMKTDTQLALDRIARLRAVKKQLEHDIVNKTVPSYLFIDNKVNCLPSIFPEDWTSNLPDLATLVDRKRHMSRALIDWIIEAENDDTCDEIYLDLIVYFGMKYDQVTDLFWAEDTPQEFLNKINAYLTLFL